MHFSRLLALSAVSVAALVGCSSAANNAGDSMAVATETAPASQQVVTPKPPEFPDGTMGTVVEVRNGNTLVLNIEGKDREVRLINVLAPHERSADISGSCLVNEATDFTRGLLPVGTEVTLNFDPAALGTSGYLEAAVYKGEEFVNRTVVAEGFGAATYLSFSDKFYQEISEAQLAAVEAGKGVYSPDTECSIQHMLNSEISAVQGAGSLSEDDAKIVYREASDFYNDLQRTATNPASWAGSITTLEPTHLKMTDLLEALGGNYYDQNGVKAADKERASAAPVRPGQEPEVVQPSYDPSIGVEPEPTREPALTDEELAEAGLTPVEEG
ncbi:MULTISPECIES: thermonuclease family protein [unclassified Rothia (in: high G+C Gram-positive bacteria)]|uniref:thermonuclease family protein n=1 Tax=unclassified Rothia (in: high G+C Gram-positive bacteria) TaxID=2689056 RepID=UPI00195C7D3A|nr:MULTISPECIES: hypothetical protein [unclassified Rothia (in: high G+C Gram-positive bacteria)]MBM7052291.1 hypothetical protein [Rothia sp. ZJ1223]QRZ61509.1 hypothetical protein JR346_09900 [Rothia sp. ZJ932]